MSALVWAHVITGLVGIISGLVCVAAVIARKDAPVSSFVFLLTTATACATGFVFLQTDGVTSAQLVSFFTVFLLALAVYALYFQKRAGSWNQVYALSVVGALFLDVLITITQSFLHIRVLRNLAPTQHSPVYVGVKISLLVVFVFLVIAVAKRAGRA